MTLINLRKPVGRSSLLIVFALLGCGGTDFPYKHYGLQAKSYEGMLLSKNEEDDLPLSVCKPDAKVKGKCIVMLVDEWALLQMDYNRIKETLKECQKQP